MSLGIVTGEVFLPRSSAAHLFRNRVIQTMELKPRSDLHLSRKIWHICGVGLIAVAMSRLETRESLFYLSIAAIIIIPFDILRLKRPELNHRIVRLFKLVIRIEEVGTLTGVSFLIVGTFINILLFPKKVAILATLLLAFGDPASSIFGVLFGKDKIWGRKSLQGSLACFTVCTLVCAVYFFTNNIMVERWVLVSILGGLIGGLSELVQIKNIDDNLTFPVFAGLGLWSLFAIFGGFSQ
jgi:diacylglycerol kinase (CTP)